VETTETINLKNQTDSTETKENSNVKTEIKSENLLTAKVKFNGVYLSSDGGIYSFTTDKGENIDVFDRTEIPQTLKDMTAGIQPNQQDPKFENKWYKIEYKMVEIELYDGYEDKNITKQVPQIVTIKEDNGSSDNTNNNSQSNIFNITDIKKGDKIYGLTVKSIDYQKGDYFSIQYDGEFSVSGNVQYNDFEDSYDIYLEEKDYPNVKIKAEGNDFVLFTSLYIKNFDKFKNALTQQQKDQLNSGGLNITISVNNLVAGDFFEGGKGRIGSGAVDFVKIK
jgi:hypothetical protein